MPKLAPLSWQEVLKKLQKYGYEIVRQKGSHMTLYSPLPGKKPVTVPKHKIVGKGLLRKIVRDAQIDLDEFKAL